MLTAAEQRRVAICTRKKSTKLTNKEVAREFGVTEKSVANALQWGRRTGIYEIDQSEQLERRIYEIVQSLDELEKMSKLVNKNVVKRLEHGEEVNMSKEVTPLYKEIRESRVLLMELQGLYKQLVNIKLEQTNNIAVFRLPEKISSMEDWESVITEFESVQRMENKVDVDTTAKASLGFSLG